MLPPYQENQYSEALEMFFHQLRNPKDVDSAARLSTLGQFLTVDLFHRYKTVKTKLNHSLLDVVRPGVGQICAGSLDSTECPVVLPDYESFSAFNDLLEPIIRSLNGLDSFQPSTSHPESHFWSDEYEIDLDTIDIDPSGKVLQSCKIEFRRNLKNYDFPCNLNLQKLKAIEQDLLDIITNIFKAQNSSRLPSTYSSDEDNLNGVCYSLLEILDSNSDFYKQLEIKDLLGPGISTDRKRGTFWPQGRSVYFDSKLNLIVLINVQDHLRIIIRTGEDDKGRAGTIYKRLSGIVKQLEGFVKFERDDVLGYLSTDPRFVGSGVRFYATLRLPHLGKDFCDLSQTCDSRGLRVEPCDEPGSYQAMNRQALEITEFDSFMEFASAVSHVVHLEIMKGEAESSKLKNIYRNWFQRNSTKKKSKH